MADGPVRNEPSIAESLRELGDAIATLLWWPLLVLIALAPYSLLRWSSQSRLGWLDAAAVAVVTAVLGLALFAVSTEERRTRAFVLLSRSPSGPATLRGVLLYSLTILSAATSVSASTTYALYDHDLVTLEATRTGAVTIERLLNFFSWQFLDFIPVLSVTKTAHLNPPIQSSDTAVGLVVLVFQGVVLLPTVAMVRHALTYRKQSMQGIREEGAVRKYLAAIEASSSSDAGTVSGGDLGQDPDPLVRLRRAQDVHDMHRRGAVGGADGSFTALEADFTKAAAAYGSRQNIGYHSWRRLGVETSVLKRSGVVVDADDPSEAPVP